MEANLVQKLFRAAQVGSVYSFETSCGWGTIVGKVVDKESKRGRTGGTTLTIEIEGKNDATRLSFRDCSSIAPVASDGTVQPVVASAPKVQESAMDRIDRITRETQQAMGQAPVVASVAEAKLVPAKVAPKLAAPKASVVVPVSPLFAPVNPDAFWALPVHHWSPNPEMFLAGLLADEAIDGSYGA